MEGWGGAGLREIIRSYKHRHPGAQTYLHRQDPVGNPVFATSGPPVAVAVAMYKDYEQHGSAPYAPPSVAA